MDINMEGFSWASKASEAMSKLRLTLVFMLVAAFCSSYGQNTPARQYHDAEKERSILLTQIGVDSTKGIWALRNKSEWFFNSISFQCDTNSSSDERFIYVRGDGQTISPFKDKKVPRGKVAPWGVAFPDDQEVVRHVSTGRQDLLDVDAVTWYLKRYRVFNCRVTDVDLDHREEKKASR